jgi:hypothetical protein
VGGGLGHGCAGTDGIRRRLLGRAARCSRGV